MDLFSLHGELSAQQVRTTRETPRRVSVFDVIKAVTNVKNPRDTWADLCKRYSAAREGVGGSDPFSQGVGSTYTFSGRGQNPTPVTDARGLVTIVTLLPGQRAARFRAAGADILVRYLGGDATLIAELLHNRDVQAALPPSDPTRIFGEDVEDRAQGAGVTTHQLAGVYITRYGPKLIVQPPPGHEVLGYGYTKDVTRRSSEMKARFGGCEVLDFCPTHNSDVETLFQRHLKMQGCLIKGRVEGETGSEVWELFVVKMEAEAYGCKRRALFDIGGSNPHPLEVSDNQVKLAEAKARMEEARARIVEAQSRAKVAEAEARVAESSERMATCAGGAKRHCSSIPRSQPPAPNPPPQCENMCDGAPPAPAPSSPTYVRGNICELRGSHHDLLGPVVIRVPPFKGQKGTPVSCFTVDGASRLGSWSSTEKAAVAMRLDRGQIDAGLASGQPSTAYWWKRCEWPQETVMRTAPDSGRAAPWALYTVEDVYVAAFPSALQIEQALGCAHGTVNSLWKADGVFRAVYRFKRITLVP